jgi:pimeloyl-ACP methyl ester carboxylesterase
MAAALAGSHLEVVHGAGHLSPVEKPEAVTEVMRKFVEQMR